MGKTSYGKEILDYIMDHRQSGKLPRTTSLSFGGIFSNVRMKYS